MATMKRVTELYKIKELATDLSKNIIQDYGGVFFLESAENLYKAGWRKIPEGAVVLTAGQYQLLTDEHEKIEVFKQNPDICAHSLYCNAYKKPPKQADCAEEKPPKWAGISKRTLCIDTGVVYNSAAEASRATGINRTQICLVCEGAPMRKTAGGYRWKYID